MTMTKPADKSPKLSKSRYLSGLQCHLKLWYECYDLIFPRFG